MVNGMAGETTSAFVKVYMHVFLRVEAIEQSTPFLCTIGLKHERSRKPSIKDGVESPPVRGCEAGWPTDTELRPLGEAMSFEASLRSLIVATSPVPLRSRVKEGHPG